jgi:electron transfer flavoprotein beta subunit
MGADRAVRLSDPAFEEVDAFGKANILAAAIHSLGPFDLVLCGRQAGDVEMGPLLAERMHLPCVALVANIEAHDGHFCLKRPIDGGYEILEAPRPLLATITNDESNTPRYASVLGIRKAMRQEIPVWSAADLYLDAAAINTRDGKMRISDLTIPQRQAQCEWVRGESGAAKGRLLAQRLHELRRI